eukprot:SAG11_NODE_119_length_15911_cov_7.077599_15_plen_120_part_00
MPNAGVGANNSAAFLSTDTVVGSGSDSDEGPCGIDALLWTAEIHAQKSLAMQPSLIQKDAGVPAKVLASTEKKWDHALNSEVVSHAYVSIYLRHAAVRKLSWEEYEFLLMNDTHSFEAR